MKTKSKLKEIRFFRGISQSQLSIITGIQQASISQLENGVLLPTPSTEKMKERIAHVLKLSVEEIFPNE